MQITDCECTEAGWCERHQCNKSPMLFRACKRIPSLFALWEQGDTPAQKKRWPERIKMPCRHKGKQLRTAECPGCRGTVRVKVFDCAIHDECILAGDANGQAVCMTCPDYSRAESFQT
jgi:hypothetical protein